jgi:hypothetical protein
MQYGRGAWCGRSGDTIELDPALATTIEKICGAEL